MTRGCDVLLAVATHAGLLAAQHDAASEAVTWLAQREQGDVLSPRDDVSAALLAFLRTAGVGGEVSGREESSENRLVQIAMADSVVRSAYANWMTGFASLYLAEASLRDRAPHAAWGRVIESIATRQNVEGGFGHGGPQALASFYPTTLIAATAWALITHGLARISGHDAPSDSLMVADALTLLAEVQTTSGAFPYGGRAYRKGPEAGRTAGVVAALTAIGRREHATFAPAVGYLKTNWASVPDGHASPAMHVLFGALAACALGPDAWRAFDETVLERVRAAQRPDGSFDDIVAGSPDSLGLMGDEVSERAYRTACYAAALALPGTRLGKSLREGATAVPTRSAGTQGSEPAEATAAPRWSREGRAADAIVSADAVRLLDDEGNLHRLAIADGRPLADPVAVVPAEAAAFTRLLDSGRALFLVTLPGSEAAPASLRTGGHPVVTRVRILQPDGTVTGPREVRGSPVASGTRGPDLLLSLRGGAVTRIPAAGGDPEVLVRMPPAAVNACLLPLQDGGLLCGVESEMTMFDAEGAETWYERTPRRRGMTPPAWTAACTAGGQVVAGATDGSLVALSATDGRTIWRTGLATAVRELVGDERGRAVLASCWDGSLRKVEDGRQVWRADVGGGLEIGMARGLVADGDVAWMQASDHLVAVRLTDGSESSRWPNTDGRFAAGHGIAIALDAAGIRCLEPSP